MTCSVDTNADLAAGHGFNPIIAADKQLAVVVDAGRGAAHNHFWAGNNLDGQAGQRVVCVPFGMKRCKAFGLELFKRAGQFVQQRGRQPVAARVVAVIFKRVQACSTLLMARLENRLMPMPTTARHGPSAAPETSTRQPPNLACPMKRSLGHLTDTGAPDSGRRHWAAVSPTTRLSGASRVSPQSNSQASET